MALRNHQYLLPTLLCALIVSCAPFSPSDHRAGICNELNKKIIFTGSTANPRGAEIQASEYSLLQRQYEENHCDG